MRIFLGIPLAPAASQAALEIQSHWRSLCPPGLVSWVLEPNFHLTLRFMGEVTPPAITSVCEALASAALACPSVPVVLDQAACFPDARRPAVLVLEATAHLDLAGLVLNLDQRLLQAGFGGRDRPFRAHVTLGRIVRRSNPGSFAREGSPDFGQTIQGPLAQHVRWTADRAVVYRSFTEPRGARYVPLAEFTLGMPR